MLLRCKVFQVLVYLLEQRDRVVSRDEVLAQVWPDQYVGEETLTSCVKAVRRAVGDSGRAQRVMQAIHGHGLRFIADVTVAEAPPAPGPAPLPSLPLAPEVLTPELLVGRGTELPPCTTGIRQPSRAHDRWGSSPGRLGGQNRAGRCLCDADRRHRGGVDWARAVHRAVWSGEAYLPALEALGRLCRGPEGAHCLPQADQQIRNKGRLHLDADPVEPLAQQVPAAQHTFAPAEKQFRGLPRAIRYGDQLRVQVQPIGARDYNVGRAILLRRAWRDLHHAERLRQQAGMVRRPQVAEDRITHDTRV